MQHETRVALAIEIARGLRRLTGLIGRRPPAPGTALAFTRCRSVHGFFMAYPIDVVFVDREWRVVRAARLDPWRVENCRAAVHVLELRAGEIARLGIAPGTWIKKSSGRGGEFPAPIH